MQSTSIPTLVDLPLRGDRRDREQLLRRPAGQARGQDEVPGVLGGVLQITLRYNWVKERLPIEQTARGFMREEEKVSYQEKGRLLVSNF